MKECCFNGECFDGFRDLRDRIADLTGKAMFDYIHANPKNVLIDKVPKGSKWSEFLFDYWNYLSQKDFMDEFTTSVDVNHYGNDKIYVNWRLLDIYKGRYRGHNLTHNMVDICLYIPGRNLYLEEHFCYHYFACSHGSPDSLLRACIKEGLAKLYNHYYVTTNYRVVINHQTFRCYTGPCCHQMDASVPSDVVNRLLNWCYDNTYPLEGQLKWVSDFQLHSRTVQCCSQMEEILDYAYILFYDKYNIIGPSDEWPLSILKLFWRPHTKHWERFI